MQVMRLRPRHSLHAFIAILFAAALVVTGCSSSPEQSSEPLPDAATLLQDSAKTTRELQSAHLKLSTTGEIPELPIETLEGDLTNTPAVAAQGTTNLALMGQRLEGVQFSVVDGTLYAALTPGSGLQDFGPAADIFDVSAILDPNRGLANLLANFTDAKADGRENIAGADTVRVTGTVSAEAVNSIAPQLAATGPVPATAWIAENDKKELVQAQLQPKDGVSITMTFTDWGKPVTVTKPAV